MVAGIEFDNGDIMYIAGTAEEFDFKSILLYTEVDIVIETNKDGKSEWVSREIRKCFINPDRVRLVWNHE